MVLPANVINAEISWDTPRDPQTGDRVSPTLFGIYVNGKLSVSIFPVEVTPENVPRGAKTSPSFNEGFVLIESAFVPFIKDNLYHLDIRFNFGSIMSPLILYSPGIDFYILSNGSISVKDKFGWTVVPS